MVSNARILYNAPLSSSPAVYQACFSPDNSKLYLSYRIAHYLFQFDLTDTSLQTNTSLGAESGYFNDPQLGLDGKIYIHSLVGNNSIDCIASPNLAGTACNLIPDAVILPASSSNVRGLHNLYVKPPRDTTYSSTDTTLLAGSINLKASESGYFSYLWNDGTITTDSDRVVNDTGTYWVTYGNYYCSSYIDTFIVRPFTTGVAQVKGPGAAYLTAYPSPAQSTVTVTINGIDEISGILQMIDATGRVVLIQICTSTEQTINIGDMAAGVYTVEYLDKTLSVRLQKKLVVSK